MNVSGVWSTRVKSYLTLSSACVLLLGQWRLFQYLNRSNMLMELKLSYVCVLFVVLLYYFYDL